MKIFLVLFILNGLNGFAQVPTPEDFFNNLSHGNMDSVQAFYAPDALFEDPVVSIRGNINIKKYYVHLYENVNSIKFNFSNIVRGQNETVLFWKMTLSHKSIKSGASIDTIGSSYVKFDSKTGQAINHRDYFDMGSFIYEHIPILGYFIRYIKTQISGAH